MESWANHFLLLNVNNENKDLLNEEPKDVVLNTEIMDLKNIQINNKADFEKIVNTLKFRYAKTYSNYAPHEYVFEKEEGVKLEVIRQLNRFIQENYDEIEIFAKKEYKVLFVGKYKYWAVNSWKVANILNRNWDFKNEDGTTNTSITQSYMRKY